MFNRDDLLEQLGSSHTKKIVERFEKFAYIPTGIINELSNLALQEDWGKNLFVLKKYIAVHVPWSIETHAYTFNRDQFYVTAGHLQTRYGTPIYLVFEKNRNPNMQPWVLKKASTDIYAPDFPLPPSIPLPPQIEKGAEIVMSHDHILGDNEDRVSFLKDAPPVAQMCAVSGSIQWSINRSLQFSYWYYGRMNYLVPLYLRDREDITKQPDVIATVQVNSDNLRVRTVLAPYMPYANARMAVKRHDQLPPWLLDSWRDYSSKLSEDQLEDPEQNDVN